MVEKKAVDITLEVLINIRDEIRGLREDTNKRFEQMDRRFEQMDRRFERMDRRFEQMDSRFERMEKDIAFIRQDMHSIVARFDRDYLLLADDMEDMKKRLRVCEQQIGIP